jgi:hypothetical protein
VQTSSLVSAPRIVCILTTCLICSSLQLLAQSVPEHVRRLLDKRFPSWTINTYSLPAGCIEGEWARLDSSAKSFYSCRLNEDEKTDYAIRFVTGHGERLLEYFVAVVSNAYSYDLFVLDSCAASRGAGHRYLHLLRAGKETPLFGIEDTADAVYKYARAGKENAFFPVDAVILEPICESYYKAVSIHGYVFIRNQFYEFSPAD